MSDERDETTDETTKETMPPSESPEQEPELTPDDVDAAKLSDEAAAEAARAFLGTAEPVDEVSVDEAKKVLRRAGAGAEAEPGTVPAPVVEAQPAGAPHPAPTAEGLTTG